MVFLLPYLTKSPPNMLPRAIPTKALVDKIVMLKSITCRSLPQFIWYLKAGEIGPVEARASPNYMLLAPTINDNPIRYDRLALYSFLSSLDTSDLAVFEANLVEALSVFDSGNFFNRFYASSS